MNLRTVAMVMELIGGLCGWIWIIASLAVPALAIWAIFGQGRWLYVIVALVIAGVCKGLTREFMNRSKQTMYESTGIDFAKEWIDLPAEDKKKAVLTAAKEIVHRYHPNQDVESWVSRWDADGVIDQFVEQITGGYLETGLKRPYQVVCPTFIDNYFQAIPKAMENSTSK